MYFPNLLMIRRISEGVGDDRWRDSGEEGFVDQAVVGGNDSEEVENKLF